MPRISAASDHEPVASPARGILRMLQAELEVLAHRHVRIERVALEDHRDVAVLRRHVVDHAVADRDRARR